MKRILSAAGLSFFGATLYAFGFGALLLPWGILPGGAAGLAAALEARLPLSAGALILLFNLPLLLHEWLTGGRNRLFPPLWGILLTSVLSDLFAALPLLPAEGLPAALAGGALMGLGIRILLSRSITTGGSDLFALILHRYFPRISLGAFLLLIDGGILLFSFLLSGGGAGLFYSLVAVIMLSAILELPEG